MFQGKASRPEERLSPENRKTIFEIQKKCTRTKDYPGVFAYNFCFKSKKDNKENMRNFFCFIGMAGIVLLIAGHYFFDNGRYCYFLGIALMAAAFIGINKT